MRESFFISNVPAHALIAKVVIELVVRPYLNLKGRFIFRLHRQYL